MRIKTEHVGLAAFAFGVVTTAALIWMGLTMQQLPEWLLALTTVF